MNEMPPSRLSREEEELKWYLAHSLKQKSVWAAENEVRMLLGNIRPDKPIPELFEPLFVEDRLMGYKVYYPKHCLKKCIAGLSISDKNLEVLKSITKQIGIPLTRMTKGNPFNLIEQPI